MRQREGDFTMRVYCGFDLAWLYTMPRPNSDSTGSSFSPQTLCRAVYGLGLMRKTVSHQHPLNCFGMR